MSKVFKKILFLVILFSGFVVSLNAQIIISGVMANPGGTDSNYEYVQLIATQSIDFSSTPYSVVVCNNGTANANGWVTGGTLTYGFNITSGTVALGDVFYVGGSGQRISGSGSTSISSLKWVRTINNVSSGGDDGLGTGNSTTGVFGNGGTSDGVAVFSGKISTLTNTTVPVDAIFYGTSVGGAKPSTGGYTVPDNDRYSNSQGTFGNGTNTYFFPDATSNTFIKLTGTYNFLTSTWITNRTGSQVSLSSTSTVNDILTGITLAPISTITSGSITDGNIYQGSTNNPIYMFDIAATGDDSKLDSIKVKLAGSFSASDIASYGLRFWYSSDNSFSSADSLLDSVVATGPNTVMFKPGFKIVKGSQAYFFITADISATATLGDTIFCDSTYFSNIFIAGTKKGSDPLIKGGYKIIISSSSPKLSAGSLNNFGKVIIADTSAEQVLTISGSNLYPASGTVVIYTKPGYKISFTSGSAFSDTFLTTSYSAGNLSSKNVYVVFSPSKFGSYSNYLFLKGGGDSIGVNVDGEGISDDTVAPGVTTAFAVSLSSVKVVFSEAVDTSAENIANYTGLGTINTASLSATKDTVTLKLTTALSPGIEKTLTIDKIKDTCYNHNTMKKSQSFKVKYGTIPQSPTYNIGQVTTNNATGNPDSINVVCKLNGIVQSGNLKSTTSTQLNFFLHDGTGGINVFKSTNVTPAYTPKPGDSIRVIGKIAFYNGLTEIAIDSLVVLDSLKQTRIPVTVTKLDETTESEIVTLKNLRLITPSQWPATVGSTKNVDVTNGKDTFQLRIFGTCSLQGTPAPTGTFDMSGVGAQFDASSPYFSSYQLFPRCICDINIHPAPAKVVINEFLANGSATEDWIELYNPGSTALSLNNFYLSNDTLVPLKWKFPDTIIKAGGYIIVWANSSAGTKTLEANFGLKKQGEEILVTGSDLKVSDYVKFNVQKDDTTFARIPNGTGNFKFAKPTPNAANEEWPKPILSYKINQINTVNASGVADSLNVNCRLTGIVYSQNFHASNQQFWMDDATGGINVFQYSSAGLKYKARLGDKIRVVGKVAQYRGLLELLADSIVLLDSNQALPTPKVVTKLDETTENILVKIKNLSIVDTTSNLASGINIRAKSGNDTFIIRIDDLSEVFNKNIIDTSFDLIGIGGQFSSNSTAPFLDGYQINPRFISDIELHQPGAMNEAGMEDVVIYPNPSSGTFIITNPFEGNSTVSVFDMTGKKILTISEVDKFISINMNAFGSGFYLITVLSEDAKLLKTGKVIIK